MAVSGIDDTQIPTEKTPPLRPSWEAARPAPAPRQVPAPSSTTVTSSGPRSSPPKPPYYAAPPAPPVPPPAPAASMPALDPNIRYDLAGNPIAGSGASVPAAPPAPFGYSAGNPAAAGVWPPPVGGTPRQGAQAYRNNSGEQSHLPPEIERLRWHWGAFFFPILWTKKHGLTTVAAMLTGGLLLLRVVRYIAAAIDPAVFLGICVLYGVAYFGLQLFCGFNGHKIGWRNRHFPGGVEEYFKVQSAWMWWGFGVNFFVVPMLVFTFFAAIVGTILATPQHRAHSYSSGYGSGSRYEHNTSGNDSSGSGQ